MERVTGIGGIFFKAKDPEKLRLWYRDHLGIESKGEEGAAFEWLEFGHPDRAGMTVWAPFPDDTSSFHDQLPGR
jgi:hypothetical protein